MFPGFAAADVLYREDGAVGGIVTGDMGVGRDGEPTDNFMPGMELRAKYTFFAEGCRGHLGRRLMERFSLRDGVEPQTYGIGIKELWEVRPERHRPGLVVHTAGWPLDSGTYGGSFLYHLEDHQVAVGFVVGLDYENPYLSPFEEMQRFKTHPKIRETFEGGRRISYGARAINEGGLQCLPKLAFPGGVLVGCEAGTLNTPKIKGTHTAMKSGMLAAEDGVRGGGGGLGGGRGARRLPGGVPRVLGVAGAPRGAQRAAGLSAGGSWAAPSMPASTRCSSAGARRGRFATATPTTIGSAWRRTRSPSSTRARTASSPSTSSPRCSSPGPTTRRTSPSHLTLRDDATPVAVNLADYAGPEERFCPAGVYEFVEEGEERRLQINAQNCVHCKTCDIKDPTQNIVWVAPEGGGGPNYPNM